MSTVFAPCADMSLSRHVGIYIVQQFNVHSYKRQNDTNHVTLELDCVYLVISLYHGSKKPNLVGFSWIF